MNPENIPIAENWYGIEKYPDGITRLRETEIDPYLSGSIWVISGSDLELVVDSGTGIMPPYPVISAISEKPLIAVALCHYYDHAGGMYSFKERACHRLEADALANPLNDWIDFGFAKKCKLSALPYANFDINDYSRKSASPTRLLEDGQIFDLGNRILEVLHIPGRTPGSIALWEEQTGFLFAGESLFIDPKNRHFPPEDNSEYEKSLLRVRNLPVTRAFGGHYESFSLEDLNKLIDDEIGRYA